MVLIPTLGVVVIGRNEGERLRRCLLSVLKVASNLVYVDSGSTDSSVEMASSLSVEVVQLDMSQPFTAARARNAGFERLMQINPQLEFVQFVDGDCEIVAGWLETAQQSLKTNPDLAIVFGRLRERFPERSPYNHLCDMEWNTPVGEAKECGGIAMMRVAAFQQVGWFKPSLIAGEEPELCVRLQQKGWKIHRIGADMGFHDAHILHFSQWWRRSIRGGYAYAEGAWLHGRPPAYHWVKESRSIYFWGLTVPLLAFSLVVITKGWSLLLLFAYLLLGYRTYTFKRNEGSKSQDAYLYALFCVIGKFPQAFGQVQYHVDRFSRKQPQLIEYK